jgi:hypothetical protein
VGCAVREGASCDRPTEVGGMAGRANVPPAARKIGELTDYYYPQSNV